MVESSMTSDNSSYPSTNTSTQKKWLIISWRHNNLMDGAYGEFISSCEGSYEDACAEARQYVPNFSPVGVVGVIE